MEGVSYQGSCHALLISGPAEFLNPSQHVLRQPLEFLQTKGTMLRIHTEVHWTVKLLSRSEQHEGRGKAGLQDEVLRTITALANTSIHQRRA